MKLDKEGRHWTFWTACVPFRLLYAGVAVVWGAYGRWTLLRVQGVVAALQLADMLRSFRNTVGMFGGPAWWIGMRPLHMLCYGGFVVSAMLQQWWSGIFLTVDVIIGAIAWHVVRPTFVPQVARQPTQFPILP